MIRCELGMSKAILGGTLTTQADGRSSTNALGTIHNEIRHDLLVADAQQIAATISEQILAPLALLNLGVSDRKLLPYFVFDTREAEDISTYAEALPKLVPVMKISAAWAHEKLKIPRAETEDDVLGAEYRAALQRGEGHGLAPQDAEQPRSAADAKTALFARRSESRAGRAGERHGEDEGLAPQDAEQPRSAADAKTALFARRSESRAGRAGERHGEDEVLAPERATAQPRTEPEEHAEQNMAQQALDDADADAALAGAAETLLAPLLAEVRDGLAPEELEERLAALYPAMDDAQLTEVLARALFVARVWGRLHG